MRRLRVVFACLLLAGFIPLLPTVSAIAWTKQTINGGVGTTNYLSDPTVLSYGGTNFVSIYYNKTATDLMVSRSTNSGATWTTTSLDSSTSDFGSRLDAAVLNGTSTMAACYYDATGGNLRFALSTDGGVFWSKSAIFTTNDVGANCAVHLVSSSTFYVTFFNVTNTQFLFTKSLDSGATWSTAIPIATTFTGSAAHLMDLTAKSATTAILAVATAAGGVANLCRTTNSGANWTCAVQSSSFAGGSINIQYVTGSTWFASYAETSDFIFAKTTNDGATPWSTVVVEAFAANGGSALYARNENNITIGYGSRSAPVELHWAATDDGGSTWAPAVVDAAPSNINGLGYTVGTSGGAAIAALTWDGATARIIGYRGNLFTNNVAEFAQVTINGLSGFDVDRTGNVIIARVNNGSHIRTYSGTDLSASPIGNVQTSCDDGSDVGATQDRVLAHNGEFGGYVAYIVCDVADSTDPTEIHIRNELGADPTFHDCPTCPADIPLAGFSSAGGDFLLTLNEIIEFPMDFTRTRGVIGNQHVFAWAWSSTEGSIGVNIYTAGSVGAGATNQFSVQSAYATGSPEQICAWENPADGRQYIVAVDFATTTRIWEFVPNYDEAQSRQEGTIQQRAVLNLNVANARGVGCGDDRVLVLRNNDLTAIEASTGVQEWRIEWNPALIPSVRSVALSDDGNWFAYHDGANLYVGNAETGAVTCTLDGLGDGSIIGMELEREGQQLYVAQSGLPGNITMWAIQQGGCTTEEPTGGGIGDGGDDDEPGDGLLADSGQQLGDALGIGTFGGNLAIGAMIILAMTGTGVGITTQATGRLGFGGGSTVLMVGGLIGAIVGVLVAWAFGFLAASAIFAILILSVLSVYFFRMRSSG